MRIQMPYNCAYVFSVIMDNQRSIGWVDRLISSEVIEEKSPHKHRIYIAMDTPFPFNDREFVYDREFRFDDDGDSISVTMRSVEHEKFDNDRLRATIHYSAQRFKSIEEGEKCMVRQTHADPGGIYPWVVTYTKRSAYYTSLAPKEELKKGH